MKYLSIVFYILFTAYSFGQDETTKLYSVEELQEDYTHWTGRLKDKSPMLYYYNSKEDTEAFFDSIYTLIDHPMSNVEFYNLIAPTTFFLKDVHSGVQADGAIDQKIMKQSLLPIDIVWLEQGAFVAVSDSLNQIQRGSQVMSINGVDINDILHAGMVRVPNDGYSIANSKFAVSSNFWLMYHRIYGISDFYDIEYINESDEKKFVKLQGANWRTLWNLREGMNRPMFKDDLPLITVAFIDSLETAILTVRSFDNHLYKDSKQGKFDPQIKDAIKQIEAANVSNIILDIRANGGGDPMNGKLILKYLFHEKFKITLQLRVAKRGDEKDFFKRTKKKWLPFNGLGTFRPSKHQFFGNVYTLIDGGTSSAAGEFSGVLRKYQRSTFIGSETGGNPIILSGTYIRKPGTMANTKLRTFVGTMCSINGDITLNEGYGLLPDYHVQWTPNDLLAKEDPVLHFTYKLIQKEDKQREILGQLKDSINSCYGFDAGGPRINSGPCGRFAKLFYEKWNERFDEKVTISFIMSEDSIECYHVLVKFPNGNYYDGGNGILTKNQLVQGFEKGTYIIDMLEYDYDLLDEMSYGLDREYVRCPNYSDEVTSKIIDDFLDELLEELR